jgi:hypothetical protein
MHPRIKIHSLPLGIIPERPFQSPLLALQGRGEVSPILIASSLPLRDSSCDNSVATRKVPPSMIDAECW